MTIYTNNLTAENHYKTILWWWPTPSSWDMTFTVWTAPVATQWFIIISPDNVSQRERVFFHDRIWSTIYVKWINRSSPKAHANWETVQINDVAEWLNYYWSITSSTFYIIKDWDLSVTVWGWPAQVWTSLVSVTDTDLTMINNTTNYIFYNEDTNTIATTTSQSTANQYNRIGDVITSWWLISEIKPIRAYPMSTNYWITWATWPTWAIWATGATWSIWNPWAIWQQISDIIIPPTWSTVTTNDTIWIRITLSSWIYTEYKIWSIITYDTDDNILTSEIKSPSWTFWTNWITYSDWMIINKVTWEISYIWSPAYRNQSNEFTKEQKFDSNVSFLWKTSFAYENIWSVSWWFTYDWNNWNAQKVTLTWSSANTCTFNNLSPWCYVLIVVQSGTGTLQFAIWTWNWSITWTAIINSSFTSPHSISAWTHIYTMLVADIKIHISYTWSSI